MHPSCLWRITKNPVTVPHLSASPFMPTFTIQFTVSVTTLHYYGIYVAAETTCDGEENVLHISLPWHIQNMEYYENVRIFGKLARCLEGTFVIFFQKGSKTFNWWFKFFFVCVCVCVCVHAVGLAFSTNSVLGKFANSKKKKEEFSFSYWSLRPYLSVRVEQLGSLWTDFLEKVIWVFSKICRENSSFIKIWQE